MSHDDEPQDKGNKGRRREGKERKGPERLQQVWKSKVTSWDGGNYPTKKKERESSGGWKREGEELGDGRWELRMGPLV